MISTWETTIVYSVYNISNSRKKEVEMQMKKVNFGSTGKQVPAIVMGCMRMKELTVKEAAKLVDAAMAEGVDFFDHADIYGGGVCEERFKEAAEEAKISVKICGFKANAELCRG